MKGLVYYFIPLAIYGFIVWNYFYIRRFPTPPPQNNIINNDNINMKDWKYWITFIFKAEYPYEYPPITMFSREACEEDFLFLGIFPITVSVIGIGLLMFEHTKNCLNTYIRK